MQPTLRIGRVGGFESKLWFEEAWLTFFRQTFQESGKLRILLATKPVCRYSLKELDYIIHESEKALGLNLTDEQRLAVFIDFDNLAIGAREAKYPKFDIDLMLERLLEKGKIVYKKAYADWSRYLDYKRPFHENAIELIDIPQRSYTGKNSADIRLVVDAMDLCYSKGHITTFVIASGDSDFSPLVSKLKENDKRTLGVGVKNSSSDLLVSNCDEFIFYEDLVRGPAAGLPSLDQLPEKRRAVFRLMLD